MAAPTPEQLDHCLSTIQKANAAKMGVLVHCYAGKGRTGTILASWLVSKGMTASEAIRKVRELRPGSLETSAQEEAVEAFALRVRAEVQVIKDMPNDPSTTSV
jgi:atypical dual specificity phosphatase